MADSAPPLVLLVGVMAGIATTAAAVWFYNRFLAPFVELPIKKPAALLALPSGFPVAIIGIWRLANGSIAWQEQLLWLVLALGGFAVTVWLLVAAIEGRLLTRGSRYRRVTKMPPAIGWREFDLWQRVLLWLLQPINQVGALRIHQREVVLANLPQAFDEYRIVHVTDPHVHPTLNSAWYEAAINAAMDLKPDLVLHGGDFITQPQYLPDAVEVLRPLNRTPDGVLTVRGNHDLWKGPQRVARAARQAGMRLLSNQAHIIHRGHAALAIIGIEDPYLLPGPLSESNLRRLPRTRIALVHTPDAYPLARRLGCTLALAGHTHGGQVRLPLIGATVTSSAAGPRHATGVARMGPMQCIASNGLGAFFPLRFLCPPEITLIVLRTADSA